MSRIMGLGINEHVIPKSINEFRKWFSFNTGNLLFYFAAELLIKHDGNIISWGDNVESINSETSPILLPMANQIGRHVDLMVQGPSIDSIKSKIAVVGLGAQFGSTEQYVLSDIPEGSVEWLRILTQNNPAKNISVRGLFTKKILEDLGFGNKVVATGCPSLFISPHKNLGSRIIDKFKCTTTEYKKKKLAIAAGSPFKRESMHVEKYFIKLVDELGARYIIQNPKQLVSLASGWALDDESKFMDIMQKRWMPSLNSEGIKDWLRQNGRVYISVPQWVYDLSRMEFCVGTRIHGVQAAIQAGTPAVCVCIDSRTRELCDFMKIPSINIEQLSGKEPMLEQFFEVMARWDWKEFDENRLELAQVMGAFFRENGFDPTDHLLRLEK